MKQFLLITAVLLTATVLFASEKKAETFRNAPPEVEAALRARVVLFYDLFKAGKFRQAEELVSEESKDIFYNTQKKALMGYELTGMTFNDDFREADVLVNVDTMFPMMGATPFKVPIAGKWRWINDNWFLHIEPPGKKGPFGEIRGSQDARPGEAGVVQGAFASAGRAITPESLSRMYTVNRNEVKFPSNSNHGVERTVTFANTGPMPLTLEHNGAQIPGLIVDVGEGPLEPGKNREITFRYHAEIEQLEGERTIIFDVLPIMRKFGIKATFPKPSGARSTGAAPKSEPAAVPDEPAGHQPPGQ